MAYPVSYADENTSLNNITPTFDDIEHAENDVIVLVVTHNDSSTTPVLSGSNITWNVIDPGDTYSGSQETISFFGIVGSTAVTPPLITCTASDIIVHKVVLRGVDLSNVVHMSAITEESSNTIFQSPAMVTTNDHCFLLHIHGSDNRRGPGAFPGINLFSSIQPSSSVAICQTVGYSYQDNAGAIPTNHFLLNQNDDGNYTVIAFNDDGNNIQNLILTQLAHL